MVATHVAAIRVLRHLKGSERISQQDSNGNLAVKLLRTFTMQLEALQRYRGKGQQKVTVEHVHVNAGGQAIVGTVHPLAAKKSEEVGSMDDEKLPMARSHRCGARTRNGHPCRSPAVRGKRRCRMPAALAIKSRVAVDSHIHEGTLKRRRIERRQ